MAATKKPVKRKPIPKAKPKPAKKTVSSAKYKSLKKRSGFSRNQLFVFVLVFAVIGGYFIYRSFAASPVVASIQGEAMTAPSGSGASNLAVGGANAGSVKRFSANTSIAGSITLPRAATSLAVIARGSTCKPWWPWVSVSVDGVTRISSAKVNTTKWKSYSANTNLSAGTHKVVVTASNNSVTVSGCQRHLDVDLVTFYGPQGTTTPSPAPAPTPSPTPTPTPTPASSGLYGIPWQSDGLANLEIGKATGRIVSIRFKAQKNETLTNVRFYLIYRAAGYYSGDGGQVKVELQTDSGGFPSGTSLASYTITNPMGSSANASFPNVALNSALTAGHVYHIVFTNPSSNPVSNWVSLDDLSGTTPQPADSDLAITWKYSSSDSWAVNNGHTPIVELTFADGSKYGQQYIDVRSSSGLVSIGGSTTASESFTPGQNHTVAHVHVYTRKSGSPSALNYTLYENNSQVASASVPASSISTSYDWVTASMPYTLKSGSAYRLTISSSTGTYNIYPYQKGTGYGFSDSFPDGSSTAGFDFPIYFGP